MTPSWLLQNDVGLCPCGCIGKRRRGSFVDKTITGGARLLRQALSSEDMAARDGLLQRIDPRVKLVTMFGLLVVASLVRTLPVLAGVYLLALVLAALSKISVRFFVKRVWLFIPIFTGIVVLPATFSFITPGHIVVPLGDWFGHPVGLTSQGLRGATLIVVRVATSISLVVLVAMTTSWTSLLAALRALFLPRMFVLVLGIAFRYVFYLSNTVTELYEARKARTARATPVAAGGRAFVGATAGTTFGKAHAMSEEVHLAMVSRGYTGEPRTLSAFRLRPVDVAWIAGCVFAAIAVLGIDRVVGR
jgi:cobalt/nickel transport system permease protein